MPLKPRDGNVVIVGRSDQTNLSVEEILSRVATWPGASPSVPATCPGNAHQGGGNSTPTARPWAVARWVRAQADHSYDSAT
jgi:hypothetical protein